jgi:hypothetical protein
VTYGGTRLPRRNRKGGDGHSPPNGVARPDSIPTSARYVPWEPEVGDCLRRPGARGEIPRAYSASLAPVRVLRTA